MTFVGVETRQGQPVLAVEIQFTFGEFERLAGDLALNRPVEYIIGYCRRRIGQLGSRDHARGFHRGFIVAPLPSMFLHFFFLQWEERLRHRFVVPEGAHGSW